MLNFSLKVGILPVLFIATQLGAADGNESLSDRKNELMLCASTQVFNYNSDVENILFHHLDYLAAKKKEHDCACDAFKAYLQIFLQEMKNGARNGTKYELTGRIFLHINEEERSFKTTYYLYRLKTDNPEQFKKYKTLEIITVDGQYTQKHLKKFDQLGLAGVEKEMMKLQNANFILTYEQRELGFNKEALSMNYIE